MPRPCSACNHPQAVAITQALASGAPVKRVAAQFGVAAASLFRHKAKCLGGTIPSAAAVTAHASRATAALATLPDRDQLGQAYDDLRKRADAITTKAESDGSLAVALSGVRELRSILDAVGKLAGHLGSGAQVNVQTNVALDLGSAVRELLSAIGDRPSPLALKRLEAIAEGHDDAL
jgi:transposase-like protein